MYVTPSSVTCTDVPELVRPEIVGRISSTSAPSVGESMIGAGGAFGGGGGGTLVSMVNVIDTDALTFPATSSCCADTLYVPSAKMAGAVQVHFAAAFTDAWHTAAPARETDTTAPDSPVPVKTGRFTAEGVPI